MFLSNFLSVEMQFETELELQKRLWMTKELTVGLPALNPQSLCRRPCQPAD